MTSYKIKYSMVVEYVKEETSLIKRAENKLDSDHVQSMQFDGTLGIISGVVKASMNNESHQVEIHLKSDGIDHTSCTCARGAHPVCSHRVAILLHGLSNISPTDSACSWRAPSGSAVATTSSFPSSRKDYEQTDKPLREEDRIGTINSSCILFLPSFSTTTY
ncbi:hypothetical protein M8J77_011632 [Diaphorina citri]|nr:hypothetical protein M8J77_011632 [Diaphorina citri]